MIGCQLGVSQLGVSTAPNHQRFIKSGLLGYIFNLLNPRWGVRGAPGWLDPCALLTVALQDAVPPAAKAQERHRITPYGYMNIVMSIIR